VTEEAKDAVDYLSDTACTLVGGFPGAFRWEPDTYPAGPSGDRPRG